MNALISQDAATPLADSSTQLIPLTKGLFTVVDSRDYAWLSRWKWCANNGNSKTWRAKRGTEIDGKHKTIMMHRAILNAPRGVTVDHIDGNGLNNRRSNLRLATQRQNNYNTGPRGHNSVGLKGVRASGSHWKAYISINGKQQHLGVFITKEAAAEAYAKAAVKVAGEFARVVPFQP